MRLSGSRASVQLSHTIAPLSFRSIPCTDSTSESNVDLEASGPQTRRLLNLTFVNYVRVGSHLFGEFDRQINRTRDWKTRRSLDDCDIERTRRRGHARKVGGVTSWLCTSPSR